MKLPGKISIFMIPQFSELQRPPLDKETFVLPTGCCLSRGATKDFEKSYKSRDILLDTTKRIHSCFPNCGSFVVAVVE